MGQFIVKGARKLFGEINVGGSKNAALPIIFSCIAVCGVSTVENLPNISDVDTALDILRTFGAKINRKNDFVTIDTRNLKYILPPENLVCKIRASSYLIGACLARFGMAQIMHFGGCNFDKRPIDMHIYAASCLGAICSGDEISVDKLTGSDIHFNKISVGATVNSLIMAASADGISRIYGYAREPHIISLIEFLRGGGAKIDITDECIKVKGTHLTSSSARIIPDMIEAGTYLAMSIATRSAIRVIGAEMSQLSSFVDALVDFGAVVEYDDVSITSYGDFTDFSIVETAPYPLFPTDLQPQMAPLLALFCGGTIKEGVWHNRFGYLDELAKFGVKYKLFDGYVNIESSEFHPACVNAVDLRGGAAVLIAALASEGESVILNSELIKRGYGDIVSKLIAIGADIKEV